MDLGVCPSSVFGCNRQQSVVNSSIVDPKLQIEVQTLKSKLIEAKGQLVETKEQLNFWQNGFMAYIQKKEGCIPSHFVKCFITNQLV